jgi:hypothetical protein
MKILIGFLAAFLLVVLGTTADAQAQIYYLGNSSTVGVTGVTIQTSTCGTIGPFNVPPGPAVAVPIPAGCVVTGIWYQGFFFPVGYDGPAPPPNPPFRLIVTNGRAVFI